MAKLLRDVADDSFALLPSTWSVAQSKRFLNERNYTHVIVQHVEAPAKYFAQKGYTILWVGDEGHGEVVGTVAPVLADIRLVRNATQIETLDLAMDAKVVCLSKTKATVDVENIMHALRERYPNFVAPDEAKIQAASCFLFSAVQLDRALESYGAEDLVGTALDLANSKPVPAHDADTPKDAAPDKVVVLQAGAVIGFHDATVLSMPSGLAPATDATELQAYPAMEAPERVAAGSEFDVVVGFSPTPGAGTALTGRIVLGNLKATDECLVVFIAQGVEVDKTHALLGVKMAAKTSFHCRATPTDATAVLEAQYFFRNQLIGVAKRHVAIGNAPAIPAPPMPAALGEFTTPSDVMVTVNYLEDEGGRLKWSWSALTPAIPSKELVGKPLKNAAQFAADLMRDLKTRNYTGDYAASILKTKGQQIASLMPAEFFTDLRRVFDAIGRLPTLLLNTNEAYVPWELALVPKPLRLAPEAPPFLAAQTLMGRWLVDAGVPQPPPAELKIVEPIAVAATYTEESRKPALAEALEERDHLKKSWSFAPVEATEEDLKPYLCGVGKIGQLIHFAVHGLSSPIDNNQVLILADGTSLPVSAFGIREDGDPPRFAFVFLNACQVGMAGSELGQAAGFPNVLVRAGVSGFVAPLWVVDDLIARRLAERFYQRTLEKLEPIGSVLQSQRAAYQEQDSTTPIAYVYYGNPALVLRYTRPQP